MIKSILSNVAKIDIGVQNGDSCQGPLTSSPISEVFAWQAKQTREELLLFNWAQHLNRCPKKREGMMERHSPHSLPLLYPSSDSSDRSAVGQVLRYGQSFCLGIAAGLECKTVSLLVCAPVICPCLPRWPRATSRGTMQMRAPFLLSPWLQFVGSSGHCVPDSFLLAL